MSLTAWMDRTFYSNFANNWDDEIFRKALLARIRPDWRCLDYGAGRGNVAQMDFKGKAAFVAGVDPEPEVLGNPYLDEGKVLDLASNRIPYGDSEFDLVFSDNVMEHVQEPDVVFREIRRVLKPGGIFLAKTPNRRHYMPLIARCTPTWFHRLYNRLRGRKSIDTFPTAYRCNTRGDVARLARETGFEVASARLIEGRPEYLRLTPPTYLAGLAYERLVNFSETLAPIRCVLMFELRKKA